VKFGRENLSCAYFIRSESAMHKAAPVFARAYLVLLVAAAAIPSEAASLPAGFSESVVASGLAGPTLLDVAPDGRVFVSEEGGRLRVIKNGVLLATPFTTVSTNIDGERGLLGVTFDPNFASNGWVYVFYTALSPAIHNRVSRFTASPTNPDVAQPGSEQIIFELPNVTGIFHNGGSVYFGADGKLYISVGDNQNGSNAQSLGTLFGKLLRINPDGTIPSDNPFFNQTTGQNRAIYAYGLRNPFAFSVQPGTGRIFVNDAGESAAGDHEEVNDIARGGNYQWPNNRTGAGSFYSYVGSQHGGCVITGGDFYNPPVVSFPPSYVGKYFFADYCANWIRTVDTSTRAIATFATGISGPTDVETAPDGSVYYIARNSGQVFRVRSNTSPTPTHTPTPTARPTITSTARPNNPPTAQIQSPAASVTYSGGASVGFSGSGTDPEDGALPASAFTWEVVLHHQTHTHPFFGPTSGMTSGSFAVPSANEWDPVQFLRIHLRVTDSGGATTTVTRDIQPLKVNLSLSSSPSGLALSADSVTQAAPFTTTAVAGVNRVLTAPAPQTMGETYYFAAWSNGGARSHTIVMPGFDSSYLADFRPASAYAEITPLAGMVTASASDANVPANAVDNNLNTRWSADGDGQWLQLDLGSNRTIGHAAIAAYNGNVRRNRFDLQVSTNGSTWITVFSGESSGTTLNEETYDFADVTARYFRYLGHGNTTSTWNSVTEMSLFGIGTGPTPTATPSPTGTTRPTSTLTSTPTATPTPTPTPTATTPPSTNLALGRPATASSVEATGFEATMAVDGSASTRWSSVFSDPQWIYVDLGNTFNVSRVVLRWEAAFGSAYQIQVSNNASTWTTIFSTTTGDGGIDDLAVSGSGRFVRMNGTARGTPWGYSLFEMEVYGSSAPTPTAPPRPTNRALGRPATASSVEAAGFEPTSAVDGNAVSTRWSSVFSDPQWIYVDLGSSVGITRVVLRWEAAFASAYQIQVSNDASAWTTIFSTTTGDGGVDDLAVSGTGRFVRMNGTTRGTPWGYSLFELEVY
jgi:glucose/arabinose dehydrogenase